MINIRRELRDELVQAAKEFPAVALQGPRQSGKSTLVEHAFPDHTYVTFEDLEMRDRAQSDPKGFLSDYPSKAGIILVEAQHVPDLFSYIQVIADREKKRGTSF